MVAAPLAPPTQSTVEGLKSGDHDEQMVAIKTDDNETQQQDNNQEQQQPQDWSKPVPAPPVGWVRKEARTQPDHYYYYNQETGESTWEFPTVIQENDDHEDDAHQVVAPHREAQADRKKRSRADDEAAAPQKRSKSDKRHRRPSASGSNEPQVRAWHILIKHKDSKNPFKKNAAKTPITITKEQAREKAQEILEVLQEEAADPESLRATFREMASEESDCSSGKRGGDLGFFARYGQMQEPFAAASFALGPGELSSTLTESNSGVHVILRVE